jgi:hypothetical protein
MNRIDEYEMALDANAVTFDQLVVANYKMLNEDGEARSVYAYYFPRLLHSFNQQHGGSSQAFFSKSTESAVILTQDKQLNVRFAMGFLDDSEFVAILSKLTLLHLQAREFLSEDDFRICMEPVFGVIAYCLQTVDRISYHAGTVGTDPDHKQAREREIAKLRLIVKELLKSECSRAEVDFYKVIQRNALVRYFYGMLAGLGLVLLCSYGLHRSSTSVFGLHHDIMATVLATGSIGAFISVLTRISSGRFSLSRETVSLQQAKRRVMMLWVLGAFRPVIGAVFAAAFVVFQHSGLIPIQITDGVSESTYYAGLAFLAGFSERWAQDMVVSTRTTLLEPRPEVQPQSSSRFLTSIDRSSGIDG